MVGGVGQGAGAEGGEGEGNNTVTGAVAMILTHHNNTVTIMLSQRHCDNRPVIATSFQ
jgi:hypothetical protein